MHPELLWREGCAFRESAKIKADVKKKLLEGQENSKFKGPPFFFFFFQAGTTIPSLMFPSFPDRSTVKTKQNKTA